MPIKRPPALIPFSQLAGADLEAHQHHSRVTDDKGRYHERLNRRITNKLY